MAPAEDPVAGGALLRLLAPRLAALDPEIDEWLDARRVEPALTAGRAVVGWRRSGGAVALVLAPGEARDEDLGLALRLATAAAGIAPSQNAPRTRAEAEPRAGIVARRVPAGLVEAIERLAARGIPVTAWRVKDRGEEVALERVAGGWRAATEAILTGLARACRVAGGTERNGLGWVRFDGPAGSIRAFPGPGGVDLQLVGADEGSLTGLHFRFGVALMGTPAPDAPPGVHLRLSGTDDLTEDLGRLLCAWLAGGEPSAAGSEAT